MSSSAPVGTRELGKDLQEHQISLLDAPVSGGVKGAVAATLAIMVGGDKALAERFDALLSAMGKRFYVGSLGSGHAAKVLNNYVSAAGLAAAAEAVLVAERFGIEPQTLIDVINASTGRNNSTENKFAQFILNGKFNSGFRARPDGEGHHARDGSRRRARRSRRARARDARAVEESGEGSRAATADHTEIARFVNNQP